MKTDSALPVGGRLVGLVRVLREAVEVEAVVPVGAADQGQTVRSEVVEGEVEGPL